MELTTTGRLRIRLPETDGRPVLTATVAEEITAALRDTTARYATIEGRPGAFCAGLDLAWLTEPGLDVRGAQQHYATLMHTIALAPCPVIALVDGVALGGGLGLAAAADLVLATPSATFGLPDVLVGLAPAIVLPFVAHRTGMARARLLALDGGAVTADAALAAGLVDELTNDLERTLRKHVKRLLRMDSRAQREVKQIAARLGTPDAEADALGRFAALYDTDATKARIARMAAGEPPWLEDVS